MRICHVASTFLPVVAGAELAVHYLAKYQTQFNHEVMVVAPRDKSKSEINTNYILVRMPIPCINSATELVLSRYIYQVVRDFKADVIHATMVYSAGFLAIYASKKLRLPLVITPEGADIQTMPEIGYGMLLNKRLASKIKFAINRADAVVAASKTIKQAILEIGVSEDNIIDIPNGVDVSSFERNFSERELAETRDKYDLRRFDNILIAVGRNHPKKGYDLLIKAVGILAEWGFNIGCLIVGRGSESLMAPIDDLNLNQRIILTGQIPTQSTRIFDIKEIPSSELLKLYKLADIFVHPSLMEGLGLVILEAMAAGLSIVAAESPGIRDAVTNGYSGLLVKPGNPHDLALKIKMLIEDKDLNSRIKLNCHSILPDYDWKNIAKKYLNLYSDLCLH